MKKEFLSIELINFLKEKKIAESIDFGADTTKLSDITESLKFAQTEESFLLRYPKPILSKLLADDMVHENVFSQFQSIFGSYGLKKIDKSEDKQKKIINERLKEIKYFDPPLFSAADNKRKIEIQEDLKKGLSIRISEGEKISVRTTELEKFLEKFKDYKELSWLHLCSYRDLPWTNDLITKYQNYLDWKYIHRNPSVEWSFELVENNLKHLNWAFISSYESLIWDQNRINQFKDFLIFSNFNKNGEYKTNRFGVKHEIHDGRINLPEEYSDYSGIISLGSNVDWSDELIKQFKDYWGWKELCKNKVIYWSSSLIIDMEDYVDFEELSENLNVEWNESLIARYKNKWDWEKLSGNKNLPWSYEFIKKYEEKWKWSARNYYFSIKEYPPCSLSTNEGIRWTMELLDEWKNRLDFWGIARFGKITNQEVLKYAQRFYQEETVGAQHLRWSDWTDTRYFFCTGWENLGINENFKINLKVINYAYQRTINKKVYEGENARDLYQRNMEVNLLGLLLEGNVWHSHSRAFSIDTYSTELEDITLKEVIENELEWAKYLISEHHIQKWFWHNVIKPFFSENHIISYLGKLQTLNSSVNNKKKIMHKVKCLNVVANGEHIGIINYNKDENTYSAEVLLNGPTCMRIINAPKNSRNKNTIKVITGETESELDTLVDEFIEDIIPNIDFEIVGLYEKGAF